MEGLEVTQKNKQLEVDEGGGTPYWSPWMSVGYVF